MAAGGSADLGRGIDKAAVGRNPGQCDQLDAGIDHSLQRLGICLAGAVVGDDLDHRPGAAGSLQIGDIVGAVLRLPGQDPIAFLEAQAVEGHVPRQRGILEQRDLIAVRTDQSCNGIVHGGELGGSCLGSLIASDPGFQVDVRLKRVDHRRRHQGGAAVVEVDALGNSGCLGAQLLKL